MTDSAARGESTQVPLTIYAEGTQVLLSSTSTEIGDNRDRDSEGEIIAALTAGPFMLIRLS